MPRTALITGASAGIGKSFAEALAGAGFNLVLTARRVDRLEALAETLRAQHRIDCAVIAADLADPSAVEQLCTSLAARGLRVDYLVNNAGYGVPGKYLQPTWPTHAQFMQVLVTSVIELSYRLLPGMLERGYGRIINVASLAGLVPGSPGHTLYAASKAFLVKFSESLHAEYSRQGIHVCALCPGFTYSEFHDVTGTRSVVAKMPSYMWMSAEAVVEAGLDAVQRGEPVHVARRVNRFIAWLMRTLPPALARQLINSRANSFRNAE